MYQCLKRSEINSTEWDQIVSLSPEGWFFATSQWLDGITAIKPWGFSDYSFGLFDNNELIAVVPLHFNQNSKTLASSGWGWSGPVVLNPSSKINKVVADHIMTIANSIQACKISLGTLPITDACLLNLRGINPWIELGFDDTSGYSQVITFDKQTEETLWNDCSKTARSIVRKAQKSDLEVKTVNWPDYLDSYYKIHRDTYQRSKLQPHPFEYFELISRLPSDNCRFYAVFKNGQPIAFHNDITYKSRAFYHVGCSTQLAYKTGANYLLMWHAILNSFKQGNLYYALGLIPYNNPDPKTRNIGFFKTRFGGDLHREFRGDMQLTESFKKRFLSKVLSKMGVS